MTQETKRAGRPSIPDEAFTQQIQSWLHEGKRVDEITATMLYKTVGGTYSRSVKAIDNFREGFETRELSEVPEPPPEMLNAATSAVTLGWRIAYEKMQEGIKEGKADLEIDRDKHLLLSEERLDLINELDAQKNELIHEVDKAETLSRQLAEDGDALKDELTELRLRLTQLDTENKGLNSLVDTLSSREDRALEECRKLQQANTDLTIELEKRHTTEVVDQRLADQRKLFEQDIIERQKTYDQQMEEKESIINQHLSAANDFEEQLTTVGDDLKKTKALLKSANTELNQLQTENQSMVNERDHGRARIVDLEKSLNANSKQLTDLNDRVIKIFEDKSKK